MNFLKMAFAGIVEFALFRMSRVIKWVGVMFFLINKCERSLYVIENGRLKIEKNIYGLNFLTNSLQIVNRACLF